MVNKNNIVNIGYQENANKELVNKIEGLALGSTNYISGLKQKILDRPARISSGISELDSVLGGGWYAGINVVTAAPGIGKTTILTQSSAAMVQNGVVVVYITHDMREIDLTAKVISTLSYGLYGEGCFSIQDILDKDKFDFEDSKAKTVLAELERTQKYLHIRDLIYDPDFNSICKADTELSSITSGLTRIFDAYCSIYQNVIFICDSLQQIAGYYGSGTTKDAVDKQLREFKQLTTYYQVPVILISTLARSAYSKDTEITYSSLKESGGIEYDADLIIALQPPLKVRGEDIALDEFRKQKYRDTIIKCLKSRDSNGNDIVMSLYAHGCTFIHSDTDLSSIERTPNKSNKSNKTKVPDPRVPNNQGYN